jgi:MYXO-CTERM domain-containing protein
MNRYLYLPLSAAAFAAAFSYSTNAVAGVEACGDIHVEANAQCEVRGGIECEASCEPVSFQAQCAARLAIDCQGECNAELNADCAVDCSAGCLAECEVEPGEFSCEGSCVADCSGSCDARCADNECRAQCEGACEAECDASCNVDPPEANCEAQCTASCEGSCSAEANIDCQIECQNNSFASCEAELQGGCEAECQTEEGALFCDGQYVDHGGNLDECVAALRALFDIEVDGYAEGRCEGNRCEGSAGGSISCAVAPSPDPAKQAALWTFLGLIGFASARRLRRTEPS